MFKQNRWKNTRIRIKLQYEGNDFHIWQSHYGYDIFIHPPHVTIHGISYKKKFRAQTARMIYYSYSRTFMNLLQSPYQTNCKDYAKIGYQSQQDCIEKCIINITVDRCNK